MSSLRRSTFLTGRANRRGQTDIRWHGFELDQPNWDDGGSRCLAFTLGRRGAARARPARDDEHGRSAARLRGAVCGKTAGGLRFADTARPTPGDIAEPGQEEPFDGDRCTVQGRSIVVLTSSDS